MPVRHTRSLTALLGGGFVLVLAACGSGASSDTSSSAAPTRRTPSSSTSEPATSEPATSGAPTTSAPTTSPTTVAPPVTTAPTTAAPVTVACTTLATTVADGGSASGMQYATITFTNNTGAPCTVSGYPSVSLLAGGKAIGSAATRSATPASTVTLAAGAAATSQVSGSTTCNAPVSDNVRVTVPGQNAFQDLPEALRACALTVGPVTAA